MGCFALKIPPKHPIFKMVSRECPNKGGLDMRKNLAGSQARLHDGGTLQRTAVSVLFTMVILVAVACATFWQGLPEAVAKVGAADVAASMDLETVLQVTPEYAMMSRYSSDSRQYRILYRKSRLRVAAAAQWVGREMGYSAVSCSVSSYLPDITEHVTDILVNPRPDFCPVADLSGRPFTGDVISVRV